jgi:hypothetical protein
MSPPRERRAGPAPRRSTGAPLWPWLIGAALVVGLTAALLLVRGQPGPEQAGSTNSKVKGAATAPIEVEEWGDFQ